MNIYDEIYEAAFNDELEKVAGANPTITHRELILADLKPVSGLAELKENKTGIKSKSPLKETIEIKRKALPDVFRYGTLGAVTGAGLGGGVGALVAAGLRRNIGLGALAGAGLGGILGTAPGALEGSRRGTERYFRELAH